MQESTKKILKERIDYSNSRLNEVKSEIRNIKELELLTDTCIYVTGSFARKEATEKSDLDLFFVSVEDDSISKLDKTLVDAELIKLNKRLGFEDFSKDGRYLEIHSLSQILEIGSQFEDFKNYYTGRMLLLLESIPIYNGEVYEKVIDRVIDSYLRDFHGHETEFLPSFLVNDITRYYKTICLNYEHRRNRIANKDATEDEIKKIKLKAHRKNLKLKFSRKFTCYSFVFALVSDYVNDDAETNHESIKAIVKKTPMEIFLELSEIERAQDSVAKALDCYSYFLELSNKIDDWLIDKNNRNQAFEKSREFHSYMIDILFDIVGDKNADILRYIIF